MLSQQTTTNVSPHETTLDASRPAPNLLVIGAMKASTTTFYELITRHPSIWFCREKEPHYFTSPDYGRAPAWQAYLRLFASAPSAAMVIGEASTGYSKLPHFGNTPRRLQESLDNPQFIYLIRDPVERTISNYRHAYLSGHYPAGTTLTTAIHNDPILVDASRYARQIRAYREVFGEDKLLVIPAEQLHAEPQRVMRRVERFLNVAAYDGWDTGVTKSNSQQALSSSLAVQSVVPQSLLNALRRLLTPRIRERLKRMASRAPTLPPVTESERQLVLDCIAEDLRDLRTVVDQQCAPWIASWPSVQRISKG